jgi:transposase
VKESTAYYWMKRARAARVPEFARVLPQSEAKTGIVIAVGGCHSSGEWLRCRVATRSGIGAEGTVSMIAHGLPVYVALEPVDMRFGYERLGGIVRERMQAEPRSRALFVFVGKRGHTMKVLTWDGTGVIVVHKKLDVGKFELPRATRAGDQHVVVSDAIFEVIYKGISVVPKPPRRRTH